MNRAGNPNLAEAGREHRFTSGPDGTGAEAARKKAERHREKTLAFKSVRKYAHNPVDEEFLNDSLVKFWGMRNVPKEEITPMMVDITPLLSEALKNRDLPSVLSLYRMLGLTYDSARTTYESQIENEEQGRRMELVYVVERDAATEDDVPDDAEEEEQDGEGEAPEEEG